MLVPVLTYSLLSLLNIARKGYRFLQDKDEPKISSRIKHSRDVFKKGHLEFNSEQLTTRPGLRTFKTLIILIYIVV